jgi:hypothetical protein
LTSFDPNDLKNRIKNVAQLPDMLGILPKTYQEKLLDIYADDLRAYVKNIDKLKAFLKKLLKTNHQKLLEILGGVNYLQNLIKNGNQLDVYRLIDVLEIVPESYQNKLLGTLLAKTNLEEISNGFELAYILGALPEPNRWAFLKKLGADRLRAIIHTYLELNNVLYRLCSLF